MVPRSDSTKSGHGRSDTVIEQEPLAFGNQCSELGELGRRTVSTVLQAIGEQGPGVSR